MFQAKNLPFPRHISLTFQVWRSFRRKLKTKHSIGRFKTIFSFWNFPSSRNFSFFFITRLMLIVSLSIFLFFFFLNFKMELMICKRISVPGMERWLPVARTIRIYSSMLSYLTHYSAHFLLVSIKFQLEQFFNLNYTRFLLYFTLKITR